jgi:hypothetical protein
VNELGELCNSCMSISVVTGSSSQLPSLVFKRDKRPKIYEQYRDLNDSKHAKYNLLPLTSQHEAKEFYSSVTQGPVPDAEIMTRQWATGGVYGNWRDATTVVLLPGAADIKSAVLLNIASKIDVEDRATVSPFELPTISFAELGGIIGDDVDTVVSDWCDTGFLYEVVNANNYALQKPTMLKRFWDRTTGFSAEQQSSLTPLTKPSNGHVAEDMFLEDYSKLKVLRYTGRKLANDGSKAKNAVLLSVMRGNLDSVCGELWTLAAEHGTDAAQFRKANNNLLVDVEFLQVKFCLKSDLVVRDIRDGFRRDFRRWRSLFRECKINVNWDNAKFVVYHFGKIADNAIDALTGQLDIKQNDFSGTHNVEYHGAADVYNILRPDAQQWIKHNSDYYPFLLL